jgi:branched-chain amino acid transport system permease protein
LFINGVVAGSVYMLIALGFGLIYATTRVFHFAHGAVYTVGAYATYLLIKQLGFPLPIALVASVLFSSALGGAIELSVYRPLRKNRASLMVLLLASLGLYVLIQNLVSLGFGDDSRSVRRGIIVSGIDFMGARITPTQIKVILVSLTLCFFVGALLRQTHLGHLARAVANDSELGTIVGIRSDRIILYVLVVGSGLAGFAGTLASLDTDVRPTMGFNALLMGVIAAFVGGIGSTFGAVVGGLVVGLAQHLGVWIFSTQWQDTIVFGVLILLLFLRPQGLFGENHHKVEG